MFKFLKDDDNENVPGDVETYSINPVNTFQSHLINECHYEIAREIPTSAFQESQGGTGKAFKYINVNELLRSKFVLDDNVVQKISHAASDLISGVYEGGFKIWECTFDLIKHMQSNPGKYSLDSNSRVLDLGCGSGLLGLFSLNQGPMVDFHDYNPEVINFLTIPNVLLNHTDENVVRCRYLSGDWSSFTAHITDPNVQKDFQYDYIVSSETVYNVEYLPSLCSLIKMCLKPTGIMLLAAKTCYFGVGGGTKAFLNVIVSDGKLEAEVLKTIRTGVQREIIAVKWKS